MSFWPIRHRNLLRGHMESRFFLPPGGDWLGALKPPFSAVFQHIQKETGQIATELPCTPNNSYHNGCQCHRIDLSAQSSLRKRYKNPQNPRYRKRIGPLSLHGTHMPNGPGITANAPTSPRMAPGHHRERCRGITTNSPSPRAPVLSAGPGASHRRTAPVLSVGLDASHREQRRFFPRAPVPASFY